MGTETQVSAEHFTHWRWIHGLFINSIYKTMPQLSTMQIISQRRLLPLVDKSCQLNSLTNVRIRRKEKLSLCLIKHVIKTRGGNKGTAPRFLNLGTRWTWMVRLTPRSPYHGERDPGRQWVGWWVGSRAGLDASWKSWISSPYRESNTKFVGHPALRLVITATEITRLTINIRMPMLNQLMPTKSSISAKAERWHSVWQEFYSVGVFYLLRTCSELTG